MALQAALIENTDIVQVKRLELLEVLKENLKKHVDEYNLAVVEYRKDVITEMTTLLDSIKLGGPVITGLKNNVSAPVSYEKEYNKLIRKYGMSVDETVYLDDGQFDSYVMDNWSWKRSVSNTYYASKSI